MYPYTQHVVIRNYPDYFTVNTTEKFEHAPTVCTRIFFPCPHKSLGTRLAIQELAAFTHFTFGFFSTAVHNRSVECWSTSLECSLMYSFENIVIMFIIVSSLTSWDFQLHDVTSSWKISHSLCLALESLYAEVHWPASFWRQKCT